MCTYKSVVIYSPEGSQQQLYIIYDYLVPVEIEGKILMHLAKFVDLVLI